MLLSSLQDTFQRILRIIAPDPGALSHDWDGAAD